MMPNGITGLERVKGCESALLSKRCPKIRRDVLPSSSKVWRSSEPLKMELVCVSRTQWWDILSRKGGMSRNVGREHGQSAFVMTAVLAGWERATWILRSSEPWGRVARQRKTNVSDERTISVFRVEDQFGLNTILYTVCNYLLKYSRHFTDSSFQSRLSGLSTLHSLDQCFLSEDLIARWGVHPDSSNSL
jgi:hypothetical protein